MSVSRLQGHESDPLIPLPNAGGQNASRWQFPKLEIGKWTSSFVSAVAKCCCGSSLNRQADVSSLQILQILNEKPSDESDFFQIQVHKALQGIAIAKLLNTSREEIIEQICANNKFSAFTQLEGLYRFQREFPEVFEQCRYQRLVDDLEEVVQEYGLSFIEPAPSQEYKLFRPVGEFEGERLVLGCGYACSSCGGHNPHKDYLVTIQEEMKPDLCADYYSSAFWREFPDEVMNEVFFEGFLPSPTASSLQEISRILRPGGIVRMGWSDSYLGVLKWVHEVNPNAFKKYIGNCGFSNFEVHLEYYRSVDAEGESDTLVLSK